MRITIIHNPTAGGASPLFDRVVDRLRAAGADLRVLPTAARGDAERFARNLDPARCDRLAVAGGDGTVNEVINGLAVHPAPPPVAIIPMGTANVLAHEIGLAVEPDAVAATVLSGEATAITLGVANGRRFILMAGAGFDAAVVERVHPALKRRFGKAAYWWASFCIAFRFAYRPYTVIIDGSERQAYSVIAANARHYAGPYVVAPRAGLATPTLDICLFRRGGLRAVVCYGQALLRNRLAERDDITIVSASRVTIRQTGNRTEPVQGDGDVIATLPVEIQALPNALNLVMPSARPIST